MHAARYHHCLDSLRSETWLLQQLLPLAPAERSALPTALQVASAEDKVSAAVHAAAALIHPFRWQHIYLPLLPLSLKVRAGPPP